MSETNLVLGSNGYHGDGFCEPDDDDGLHSIIRGTKLKFTNTAQWISAHGDVIEPSREFLAVEVRRVVQKWIDQKPVETHILAPDEKPHVDELNETAPKEEWRDRFGQEVGPWQFSNVVYLLDPATMAAFTFPTSTVGGFQAVRTLKDETNRARLLRGDNYFPMVTLGDVHMPTAFGGRQRPAFIVKTFVLIGAAKRDSDAAMHDRAEMHDRIP